MNFDLERYNELKWLEDNTDEIIDKKAFDEELKSLKSKLTSQLEDGEKWQFKLKFWESEGLTKIEGGKMQHIIDDLTIKVYQDLESQIKQLQETNENNINQLDMRNTSLDNLNIQFESKQIEILEQSGIIRELKEELYSSKTFLVDSQKHTNDLGKQLEQYKAVVDEIEKSFSNDWICCVRCYGLSRNSLKSIIKKGLQC